MSDQPKRILVADDSQNIREILKANFEIQGYEILTAADGKKALYLIHNENPDIIILDIMMPRKNGFQVCRQIKSEKAYKDIPVIMLTAKDQKEDKYWGKDCGADEYMTKPFVTSELERLVNKYIEKKKAHEVEKKISFDEEIINKKRNNTPSAICRLELDSKASTLFLHKYGEVRYSEMLNKVAQTIEKYARAEDDNMILEQECEDSFTILMEGERERIEMTVDKIKTKVIDFPKELYDGDDFRKGYILRKDIQTGQEEKVPLLSIKTGISFSLD